MDTGIYHLHSVKFFCFLQTVFMRMMCVSCPTMGGSAKARNGKNYEWQTHTECTLRDSFHRFAVYVIV